MSSMISENTDWGGPENTVRAVTGMLENLVSAADPVPDTFRAALTALQDQLGRWISPPPITGGDVTDGASEEEEYCGCGEPITWYEGEWLHIYTPELRGSDDHDAEPGDGYYVPEGYGDGEDEEEEDG